MVGKFYAIKSEKDIHKGTVISTIFAIIVAGGCYFLGGFGRLYADRVVINEMTGKPLFDTIIPTMLSTLPSIVIAVVIVLVLSASMSTLSSLVLTSSSTFTLDVIRPASKKKIPDEQLVSTMRIIHRIFHHRICSDRNFQGCTSGSYIYCPDDGCVLGSACRSISCTVFIWIVLERNQQDIRSCMLCLGMCCGCIAVSDHTYRNRCERLGNCTQLHF